MIDKSTKPEIPEEMPKPHAGRGIDHPWPVGLNIQGTYREKRNSEDGQGDRKSEK